MEEEVVTAQKFVLTLQILKQPPKQVRRAIDKKEIVSKTNKEYASEICIDTLRERYYQLNVYITAKKNMFYGYRVYRMILSALWNILVCSIHCKNKTITPFNFENNVLVCIITLRLCFWRPQFFRFRSVHSAYYL